MNRLTEYRKDLKRYEYKRDERGYCFIQEGQIVNKLGKLEDLLEKFDIESIEELEEIIQDGMCVSFDISSTKINKSHDELECLLQRLEFLEDAIDLSDNCRSSTFDNNNGDQITIVRSEEYNKFEDYETVVRIISSKLVNTEWLATCVNEHGEKARTKYNEVVPEERKLAMIEFDLVCKMILHKKGEF